MHAWMVRIVTTRARLELFLFSSCCMKLLNDVYSVFNEIVIHASYLAHGRDHICLSYQWSECRYHQENMSLGCYAPRWKMAAGDMGVFNNRCATIDKP
jgi:hypothetical protein